MIDLNKIENKFPIKKSSKSKKPLKCFGIKWSKANPEIAFIEAILSRKTRFYQVNYRNLLAHNKTYMDEWSDNIFGISSIGNEIHSYSLAEYGGEDIDVADAEITAVEAEIEAAVDAELATPDWDTMDDDILDLSEMNPFGSTQE